MNLFPLHFEHDTNPQVFVIYVSNYAFEMYAFEHFFLFFIINSNVNIFDTIQNGNTIVVKIILKRNV